MDERARRRERQRIEQMAEQLAAATLAALRVEQAPQKPDGPVSFPRRVRAWVTRHAVSISVAGVIGLVASVVGIWAVLQPNMTASVLRELDPERPLSMQIGVTNNGPLALTDVRYGMGLNRIVAKNGTTLESYTPDYLKSASPEKLSEMPPTNFSRQPPHRIGPGQTDSFDFRNMPWSSLGPISHADIGLVVVFKVWHLPIRQKKLFRYMTVEGADGKLHWTPRSLDELPT